LYFAYASFLSSEVLRRHCPSTRFVSRAYLPNFKVDFTYLSRTYNCGVASIEPSPGEMARGVIYDVPEEEMKRLDVVEAVPQGYYVRETYILADDEGEFVRAEAYRTTSPNGPYKPNRRYVGLMLQGAREHKLDPEYVDNLQALYDQLES